MDLNSTPALLLFPNLLGSTKDHQSFLPASIDQAVATIDGLIAESLQGGRSFLYHFKTKRKPHEIPIALYNEHTPHNDIDFILEPILKGERWGLVSDAGLPCVADPGSELVLRARELGIVIKAFVGPSAILLSLMQSGLPGQRFSFHGYLSKLPEVRKKEIVFLEERSKKEKATQIFIEAPYRNKHTFQNLIEILRAQTYLCVACDLTLASEQVITLPIAEWKRLPVPDLSKKPVIFLISAQI